MVINKRQDVNRLLKNAHLLRFPHPSPFNVARSTPHGSGLAPFCSAILRIRGPCICTFLKSLQKRLFQHAADRKLVATRFLTGGKKLDL